MAKPRAKSIYTSRNTFVDRAKLENEVFQELTIKIETMETALLLLSSKEAPVLTAVLNHITDFSRKRIENVTTLREMNLLQLLLDKEFYLDNENVIVKRFALYLVTTLIEQMNTLIDLDTSKTMEIMDCVVRFYLDTMDDFTLEYLSVIANKCIDDPQVGLSLLGRAEFMDKFFNITMRTDNPDTLLHSFEILHKLLLICSTETMQKLVAEELFPIDRIICDLTNEFQEVRSAALRLIRTLIVDTSENSPFTLTGRAIYVLQQLTAMFCSDNMSESLPEVIQALATALRTERMAHLFIEQNLFDRIIQRLAVEPMAHDEEMRCKSTAIFAELARYGQYLQRLHSSLVTEILVDCVLIVGVVPATHVLTGLVRLMKYADAANQIVEASDAGLLAQLLKLLQDPEVPIQTREQSVELLNQMLLQAFHRTASGLFLLSLPEVLAETFGQSLEQLSIDLVLSLLVFIERLTQNDEYRLALGTCAAMTTNLAILLKDGFSASILVANIFRCLCTLVDEDTVRRCLLQTFICNSIKRALKSLANLVKTSVTNFIIQTARFSEFVRDYIDKGVLEVLMLHQKHSFCVPTWNPAIEAILSKTPTLKFCIRNHLSFIDSTVGSDFLVSKQKFEDFRTFQNILKEEVSPLMPILVVNFNRPRNPSEYVVSVPREFLSWDEVNNEEDDWAYCRHPGDDALPRYLAILNQELETNSLVENPQKVMRHIDFENVAKRAKIIADIVAQALGNDLKILDLNSPEECCQHSVRCHLKLLNRNLHCNFIPLGMVRTGCQFERAMLFKALADQIALPCTLQRSVDGKILFNELPLPLEMEYDPHCDSPTLQFMPWRMLRPTHVIDLLYNVGELYPLQSRQALQYLRLY